MQSWDICISKHKGDGEFTYDSEDKGVADTYTDFFWYNFKH